MNEKAEHVLAHMEQLGAQAVRDMVSSGRWPANYDALAKEWLQKKDTEERARKDVHRAEAMFVAQRSNELARAAAEAARHASKLAEDANAIARNAGAMAVAASASADRSAQTALISTRIAIIALIAAIAAIAVSMIPLFEKYGLMP